MSAARADPAKAIAAVAIKLVSFVRIACPPQSMFAGHRSFYNYAYISLPMLQRSNAPGRFSQPFVTAGVQALYTSLAPQPTRRSPPPLELIRINDLSLRDI